MNNNNAVTVRKMPVRHCTHAYRTACTYHTGLYVLYSTGLTRLSLTDACGKVCIHHVTSLGTLLPPNSRSPFPTLASRLQTPNYGGQTRTNFNITETIRSRFGRSVSSTRLQRINQYRTQKMVCILRVLLYQPGEQRSYGQVDFILNECNAFESGELQDGARHGTQAFQRGLRIR